MSYQPATYRKAGGDEIVIASSGTLTVESGGKINLQSGSTLTIAGPVTISGDATISGAATVSGAVGLSAAITCASGGYVKEYVQTAATSATEILPYGLTLVAGTTAPPSFLISNPLVGVQKWITLTGTSADEVQAIITGATTTVTFDSTGSNRLTLESTGLQGVSLIGATTLRYVITGTFYSEDVGLSTG